jgi:DNA polymerase III subunit epsilon
MQVYLFFDTETTGLPAYWNAPVTDLANWPRMVQLAWLTCGDDGMIIDSVCRIIRPDGYRIPKEVSKIHGITTEIANKEGVPLIDMLERFSSAIDAADLVIAHNIDFDEKIVGAEFLRMKMRSSLFAKPRFCTMKSTVDLCRIPGNYGYKRPTMTELHKFLFNKLFLNTHDASADVAACAACFFKLKEIGYIKL